ncbi:unnamed protein product [Orchesella dallaii]|uniref:Chorion peroxidase n=1 Tax=Orchesella dallaii TaxID=48710 RepID=A0ABP1R7C5_9HEXA
MFRWQFTPILIQTVALNFFAFGKRTNEPNLPSQTWNSSLAPVDIILEAEEEESGGLPVFGNESDRFARQILYDDDDLSKNYRRYPYGGNRRNGRGYGSGPGAFAYAGGGGGWASAGGYGKGWGSKGNQHYNPSLNKYGGGGPLAFIPSKGNGGGGRGGGGGATSFASAGAGASSGPSSKGVAKAETQVHIVTCDVGDKCHSFVHCAAHTYTYFRGQDRCCFTSKQNKGMCCEAKYPTVNPETTTGKHFNSYPTDKVAVPEISQSSLAAAAKKGYGYKEKYNTIEDRLLELNLVVQKGTAAFGHLQFFQTSPEAIHTAQDNFLVVKTCNYIQETYFLTPDEAGIGLQGYDFGGTIFEKTCVSPPNCHDDSKYRTISGSCNNPTSSRLGQSSTTLLRLLPPDYADGIWAPRVRKDGSPLPGARFVSRSLVPDVNQPDPRYSHLVMQFGQFVDHDLSHVPIFRFGDMGGINCCGNGPTDLAHPACFPIDIPPNDPVLDGQCMNFVRSLIAPRIDCSFGHADQLNQLTHWLDGSQIYGNTEEQGSSLRDFSGGFLKVTRDANGRHLLPEDPKDKDGCSNGGSSGLHCFVAGDKRVNEQIGLTSIHTIFVREHNRVAVELGEINPHWDDEIIYQETRRIVIAEYQHIIYNEWLPVIIGRSYMETFGILPLYDDYYNGYDSAIDGSVSNAFTTAAFRMGHTLVQGTFNLQSGSGNVVGRLQLRDFFNNPHLLRQPGVIDLLNKGLLTQPIQKFDNFVTTELRDHLFQTSGRSGMDLIALNIQRGRDHGLPGYNEYRDLCRLGKARDFSDLSPIIAPRKISSLEEIYGSVDDIDLFIGGIHETPLEGAVVGPTFACIIGDQFVRSKRGDRYFHDHGGQPHSFSKEQLHSIRRASMSRILCDNSDEIRSLQPLAFHLPHNGFNPMLPCGSASIPRMDLRPWKE